MGVQEGVGEIERGLDLGLVAVEVHCPAGFGGGAGQLLAVVAGVFGELLCAEDTSLETLAHVGGSRWRIETAFETGKSDIGLDEYETRTWAGWHHHIAMCLLGGAFLLGLQQD